MSNAHGTDWSDSADAPVRAVREGSVLVLRLNRPQVRHAFDLATAQYLESLLDRYEADDTLRAAVLTGGPDFFCAGVDLRAVSEQGPPRTPQRGWFGIIERPPTKPIVAAVEGAALGGGFELALACDLIVASRSSAFGLPEVSRGLIASAGGLVRLPRRVPRAIATEMALLGEPLPAERLHSLGLVNRLCEPGAALQGALQLAAGIARNAPLSVAASKRVLALAETVSEREAWAMQEPEFARVRASDDYREGIAAFIEKRKPDFRGR